MIDWQTPAAARPARGPRRWPTLSARQQVVLRAVRDGRIRRGLLCGRLEPHLLDGREVIWTLRGLVIRGMVMLQPLGPPVLTGRGRAQLDRRSGTARRNPR